MADLYLLSPNAYHYDAASSYTSSVDGKYNKEIYQRMIAHEVVHMLEEHLSPKGAMEIRPVWWGEGLAVYISEQYKFDSDFISLSEKIIKDGLINPPKFEFFNNISGSDAYIWGWILIDIIIKKCGKKDVFDFIKNNSYTDKNIWGHFNIENKDIINHLKIVE